MKTKLLILLSLILAVAFDTQAGSATWSANPISGDWNTAANWTPNTVPNGPSDTATFATSSATALSFSDTIEVAGIVFNAGASAFTVTCSKQLIISGTGITNNSGATQNFITTEPAFTNRLQFTHSATSGSGIVFTNSIGYIEFDDTASAGSAIFATSGSGITIFHDEATCDSGDTARVEIFGHGILYLADNGDLNLGSIEGDGGIIELGIGN